MSFASQFEGHQCINLETYKKSGHPVTTPVWFTIDGDRLLVITRSKTGKVKRLRYNQNVRVMPCGMRGEPKGGWVKASATFATQEELETALAQRKKKYGIKATIAGVFSSGKGENIAIVVRSA